MARLRPEVRARNGLVLGGAKDRQALPRAHPFATRTGGGVQRASRHEGSTRRPQSPLAASLIFLNASSTVNVFGRWTGGKSLKVSMNLPIAACAA